MYVYIYVYVCMYIDQLKEYLRRIEEKLNPMVRERDEVKSQVGDQKWVRIMTLYTVYTMLYTMLYEYLFTLSAFPFYLCIRLF